MPSHAIQPGVESSLTLPTVPATSQPGRHRRVPAPARLMRKVVALAAKLGQTVTMVAMIALTSAILLLVVNAPDSGTDTSVPAASYNE